ncbi:DNA ligase D [Lacipirellula sp.]|uniref:DNA ligase D n=1 Tax=Lacipirellula sp. TaxID=2691419 RepID=UPI003D0ED2AA
MSLAEYQRKRDFRRSPEPAGKRTRSRGASKFVVQKHAASHLHYDFRLEIDGTLKSWAVPKGPSLDPDVKSLAVQVEDHPLDYADFEGVIPAGEYGGGTVMVWDQGTWQPEGVDDPLRQWNAGKLKFTLHGSKLKGSWALVRMGGKGGADGKNWLLIKHHDRSAKATADFDVREEKPRSVVSRRTMEQIAASSDRVWSSGKMQRRNPSSPSRPTSKASAKRQTTIRFEKIAGAQARQLPRHFSPQLATLVKQAPEGEEWLHELKFDGYRILARLAAGKVQLFTRNGHDWTHRFPSLAAAVAGLPIGSGIIDGELVTLDDKGVSDFQKLQNQLRHGDDSGLAYYAFDLPFAEGYDLTNATLLDRKKLLQKVITPTAEGIIRFSEHIDGNGDEVWQQACSGGLEGIISKQAKGRYVSGRGSGWMKVKCAQRQEFVIGGFTQAEGSRKGFGALLLGYYQRDRLLYAGRVGTGFTQQSLRDIHGALAKRTRKTAPFAVPPTGAEARDVTWVTPELVAEVQFTEWTDDGHLRHPSFQGLREDKPPTSIKREKPMATANHRDRKATSPKRSNRRPSTTTSTRLVVHSGSGDAKVAGITITHPDRIVFPDIGLTKLALAEYYERVGAWILPHVAGRPLTLVRCPSGQTGQCFYQKHLNDSMPDSVRGIAIREKIGTDEYVVVDDLPGLISLVQFGAMEFHPWPAREDRVERPDRLVFDVDPDEKVSWAAVRQAALDVRDCLELLGLQSFLRTSGGKGLHVVAPIERRSDWDEVKAFARGVAELMVRTASDRYVANMSKAKRRGKIFIDYLRNQRGATAVASYSTRAREGAPVATPLSWEELSKLQSADQYVATNLDSRLARLRRDPWDEFFSVRQSISRKAISQLK